jgi:hypothetical protein
MTDRFNFQTLRQTIHADPALQARLFALADPHEFYLAVRQVAENLGQDLPESTLREALQEGARSWHMRQMP